MSDSYTPQNVGYAVSKLDGYSRNRFKLIPTSADSLQPGSQLNIPLPEGSICDLRSLRIWFRVNCVGADPGVANHYVGARCPCDAQSFFQRLVLNLNGVQINGSSNDWNAYCRMAKICKTTFDKDNSIDRTVQHGSISAPAVGSVGVANDEVATMACAEFPGTFLADSSTRFVHTGMLGSLVITATLADNSVLVPYSELNASFTTFAGVESAVAGNIRYSMDQIYATIDCISLSSLYDEMLMARLAQEDILINYKEIYTYTLENIQQNNATTRFSLATRCLDKVYSALRPANHAQTGIPAAELTDTPGDAFTGNKFVFGVFDPSIGTPAVRSQYTINNTPYPQYLMKTLVEGAADSAFAVENEDVGLKARGNLVGSLFDYNNVRGVVPLRLDHPTGIHPETRVSSGLSTLGVNMAATYLTQGFVHGAGRASLVACETQPQLVVSVGKMCSVNF